LTRLCFAIASVATVSLVVNDAAYFTAIGVATRAAASERAVAVNVTASACEPSDLNVSAGPVTFSIHNASAGALEWEILDGVMVVAERENIPPGLVWNLTA
jgi:iron uptake system component EfeO